MYRNNISFNILTLFIFVVFAIDTIQCIEPGGTWKQLGSDVNSGSDEFDLGGHTISITADGKRIIIGAPDYTTTTNGDYSGRARVYSIESTDSWGIIGTDILGKSAPVGFFEDELFGSSVSISDNGEIIAIGAPFNGTVASAGIVRVYKVDTSSNNAWVQLGSDIVGSDFGQSGFSVAMSADGKTIAIGAPSSTNATGQVRVYGLDATSTNWTQVGSDINGVATLGEFGYSIAISADGKTVVVGAPNSNSGTGIVRVYSSSSGSWVQVGTDINGEATGDSSGLAVSMSADGNTIAIGSPYNNAVGTSSGVVRVYSYDSTTWKQLGADINGPDAGILFGSSVALSSNGTAIVIGAPRAQFAISGISGEVYAYAFDSASSSWKKLGGTISGQRFNERIGSSVAMSNDGTIIAIGASTSNGRVRVYQYDESDDTCGLFGLSLFCLRRGKCGLFRRILGLGGC